MNHYEDIMNLFANNVQFAFNRFNDGEMMGICKIGSIIARGDQIVNQSLHDKLIEAIQHQQENYWIGKPCGKCFPGLRQKYDELVSVNYPYQTHAVQFCNNGYWNRFIEDFPKYSQNRKILWISGDDVKAPLNINGKRIANVINQTPVNSHNSWGDYERIKDKVNYIETNSIVILTCGPLSRVLTYEWFRLRPDCTFFDAGSLFDPFTRNVWHRCHKGTLNYCEECNFEMKEVK